MGSKERVKNVIFSVLPMRKMGAREKKENGGREKGRKEGKPYRQIPGI